jgi:hypothetical protein
MAQWFLRITFLNDLNLFLHACYYLPFQVDMTLYLNKLAFPLRKDDFDWNRTAGSRENFYPRHQFTRHVKSFSCGDTSSRSPGTIIWRNLILHNDKKLRFSSPVVLERMTPPYISIFVIISLLKRTHPFILNKSKFPLLVYNLHQIWLKFVCWFWRFEKLFSVFFLFW